MTVEIVEELFKAKNYYSNSGFRSDLVPNGTRLERPPCTRGGSHRLLRNAEILRRKKSKKRTNNRNTTDE